MDHHYRNKRAADLPDGIDMGDWRGAQIGQPVPRACPDCEFCNCGHGPAAHAASYDAPPRVRVGCFPPPPRYYTYPPMPPRPTDVERNAEAVRMVTREFLPQIAPLIASLSAGLTSSAANKERAKQNARIEERHVRGQAVGLAVAVRSALVMLEELIPRQANGEADRTSMMPTASVYAVYRALDHALSVLEDVSLLGAPPRGSEDDEPAREEKIDDGSDDDVDIQASSPLPVVEKEKDSVAPAPRTASGYRVALIHNASKFREQGFDAESVYAAIAHEMVNAPFGCCAKVKVDGSSVTYTLPIIEAKDLTAVRLWLLAKGVLGREAEVSLCVFTEGDAAKVMTVTMSLKDRAPSADAQMLASNDPKADPYKRQTHTISREWDRMTPKDRAEEIVRASRSGTAVVDLAVLRDAEKILSQETPPQTDGDAR
jgi:hypothetical protein